MVTYKANTRIITEHNGNKNLINSTSPLLKQLSFAKLYSSLSQLSIESKIGLRIIAQAHRRYLAVQRHPHRVEHPRWYPVLLDILALQQYRRPARRNVGKQLPLHLAVKLGVGRQRRIAASPSMSP